MTNEELVVEIQKGHTELYEDLWKQVVRFIKWRAKLYYKYPDNKNSTPVVELDDLIHGGYFSVVKAIETFNEKLGFKFLTWLDYYLSKEFCRVYTNRSHWDSPVVANFNFTMSLNAPFKNTDLPMENTIASTSELGDVEVVEDSLYNVQLHLALEKALESLPSVPQDVLRRHYFQQQTYAEIASVYGTSEQNIQQRETWALQRIRHTPAVMRELFEFYDPGYSARAGYSSFVSTMTSYQERLLIAKENKEKRVRRIAEEHLMEAINYLNSASSDYLLEGGFNGA